MTCMTIELKREMFSEQLIKKMIWNLCDVVIFLFVSAIIQATKVHEQEGLLMTHVSSSLNFEPEVAYE